MTRPMAWLVGVRALLSILAVGLFLTDRLPWWFAALVVARDVAALTLLLGRSRSGSGRFGPAPVMLTSAVLLGVGMVVVAFSTGESAAASLGRVFGWAMAWWGLGLSWVVVVERAPDLRHLLVRRDGLR